MDLQDQSLAGCSLYSMPQNRKKYKLYGRNPREGLLKYRYTSTPSMPTFIFTYLPKIHPYRAHPPIHPSVRPSARPSVRPSIHPSIRQIFYTDHKTKENWSLLNAFFYINKVLVFCMFRLSVNRYWVLAKKKWRESCFTFKINSDLPCVFPAILENRQRLELSLFPK